MTSVRFCTPEMLAKYRKIQLLKDYIDQTEAVVHAYNEENGIDNEVILAYSAPTSPLTSRACPS